MKNFLLLFAILIASHLLSAQTIIKNPRHGMSTTSNLKITEIVLTDSNTVMSFHVEYPSGQWIFIPNKTYIQITGETEKQFIIKAEGIPMSERYTIPESGIVDYKLYFPAIDKSVERVDYGEDNNGGSWFIYDICINHKPIPSLVPDNLQGAWFAADGSKVLIVALYEQTAVYNNTVWQYAKVVLKDDLYYIELKNDTTKTDLYFSNIDSSSCKIGETTETLIALCNYPKEVAGFQSKEEPYSLPILSNNTARYSGYIRDFIPRTGHNTGAVHVNNVITGEQETYLVKIDESGYFSATIPMVYPEQVYVRMSMLPNTVFLEPGKETFLLFDWSASPTSLFMGEMAQVNNGLADLGKIRYYNNTKVRNEILEMTTEAYKTYCFEIQEKELKALEAIQKEKYVSPKAVQVKKTDIINVALINAISFEMNFGSAVRRIEKKDTTGQTKIDVPKADSSYYNFLNSDLLNNPLALLSSNLSSFINHLMYLNIFRDQNVMRLSTTELIDQLAINGIKFSPDELELIEKMKKQDNVEMKKKNMEFQQKYKIQYSNFYQKYKNEFREFMNQADFVLWYDIEATLKEKGFILTDTEKELIHAAQQNGSREEMLEMMNFAKSAEVQAFYSKYHAVTSKIYKSKRQNYREEIMTSVLNIEPGLCSDLMFAQDQCRGIVKEHTPVSDEELAELKKHFITPFIADYIEFRNNATKFKIEENKLKTGYIVNETPTVESEKLFDAMMEKFNGKVVFIDFWATWCAPCRSGIERMKPLKEQYEGKDIVFVYITDQTSPEGTWKNMIGDMNGEHFRVTQDEWNILSSRFGISGIPHYVMVDKKGEVANNDNMPEQNQEGMKKLFDEFIAK